MASAKRGSEVTTCLRETVVNDKGSVNSVLLRIEESICACAKGCKLGALSLNLQKSESSVNSVILNLLNNTTDHQISDRSQGSKSPSD